MKKKTFYTELAYLVGLFILAVGTALMERADFGVSMVVAPAYVLHLKISEFLPFFSFGMAEYTLQAVLLLVMMLVLRRARLVYLFSFVTAVLYGFIDITTDNSKTVNGKELYGFHKLEGAFVPDEDFFITKIY